MIISMKLGATKEEIDHVCRRIEGFGYRVHSIQGDERVVIAAVGVGDVTHCLESLRSYDAVESAVRISAPYKFVSKQYQSERTRIRIGKGSIGGDEFFIVAGPCSVETEEQIMATADAVARSGAHPCGAALSSRVPRPTIFRASRKKASSCSARRATPPASP
jgi:3-deoxy-7-phosphoheptulonate synthase